MPCEPAALLEVALASNAGLGGAAPHVDDDAATARVRGDQQRLVQMLRSLIEFAQARAGANVPAISLRCADDRLQLDIVVPDGASGAVTADELLRTPLPDPADEGLGLRLLIASSIAQAHAGTSRGTQRGWRAAAALRASNRRMIRPPYPVRAHRRGAGMASVRVQRR
jgi:C4-dicarboxylate-specific signal transduction histidine kinase